MKVDLIEQESRRHDLVRSNRPDTKSDLGIGAISGKTFIWLPFAGGMSAFAVVLSKPWE